MPEDHGCSSCGSGECSGGGHSHQDLMKRDALEAEAVSRRMNRINHKIFILSGKGGVGKSTVAVNLAVSLALSGKKVGLLDIDLHGPSVPQLLNLKGQRATIEDETVIPVKYSDNLKVMSVGFLLPSQDDAVIWRGPLKMGVIKQFLKDVDWGDLDFLIVDSPPGTGDEPLSIVQLLPEADGAVIVTTPQQLAIDDVRKCIGFCRKLSLRVLGVVENMSGFVCPDCGAKHDIFRSKGGRNMADDMGEAFLGSIPIDPQVVDGSEDGRPYLDKFKDTPVAVAFAEIINGLTEKLQDSVAQAAMIVDEASEAKTLRICLPVAEGVLAQHFGHCEKFAFVDVDENSGDIKNMVMIPAPPHQPGLLPGWLSEHGARVILAGGMGEQAKNLFKEQNIKVITGVQSMEPKELVVQYLNGSLQLGDNSCDHDC